MVFLKDNPKSSNDFEKFEKENQKESKELEK